MSIETIEQLAKRHADARNLLAERVRALDTEMQAIKRRHIRGIKSAISEAKDSRLALHAAVDAERKLFDQPRTRVLHGIKVGLQKGKGKLVFDNAEQVIKLIRKHYPDHADVLVNVEESPNKTALLTLAASDLKRIGCTIEGTNDQVLIKVADGEIDKLVDALLGKAPDEDDSP